MLPPVGHEDRLVPLYSQVLIGLHRLLLAIDGPAPDAGTHYASIPDSGK